MHSVIDGGRKEAANKVCVSGGTCAPAPSAQCRYPMTAVHEIGPGSPIASWTSELAKRMDVNAEIVVTVRVGAAAAAAACHHQPIVLQLNFGSCRPCWI